MLELPESHTIARQLSETIVGKAIQSIAANTSPHGFAWYFGEPDRYQERGVGLTVGSSFALAGFVQVEIEHMRLLFQDGVNVRYGKAEAPRPKKHQLLVEFEDGDFLYCTVQMYGAMMLFADGEFDNPYYQVAQEKPSPLTDEFSPSYFDRLLAASKPSLSAKALLATEQRIPGLGNGVLQDILFAAGIHPKRKLSTLTDPDRERMYNSVRQVLADMTCRGGRDTEKDLFGEKGGYATILSKNTLAHPCPVCGGLLVRQAYLGGNVYVCPTCQPLSGQ